MRDPQLLAALRLALERGLEHVRVEDIAAEARAAHPFDLRRPPMHTDVVIAGAGPNGLMLACELSLAGVRPTVVERARPPPHRRPAGRVGRDVRDARAAAPAGRPVPARAARRARRPGQARAALPGAGRARPPRARRGRARRRARGRARPPRRLRRLGRHPGREPGACPRDLVRREPGGRLAQSRRNVRR
ncbi:hypothetical protein C1J01_29130 [Nonomuraea aridisoli]|uniref:FAD-binding domain-containing protein n=1 Tax=Nonomuraea aridisoli TaxID=2070368 RepID=A0A2W2FDW9_9ACTN|nr:hypothetical protein C1J01_29130 [Nonomuraea aridisoli]